MMQLSAAMSLRVVWGQRPHRKGMVAGLGRREQALDRITEGKVHLVEPGEASEALKRNSKSTLRPIFAPSCVQGPTRPRSQRCQDKFIIPDSSQRNTVA